jgi:flagellar basal body rod protein FlgG
MIYGLYLSATGVLMNSYRQDVIANNLANAETVGFKRDVSLFQERLTEAQEGRQKSEWTNPMLEMLGGGARVLPTAVDYSQGEMEHTGNNFDVAIQGAGYFQVSDGKRTFLTRDGRFMLGRQGQLILANDQRLQVLDAKGKPITLDPALSGQTFIHKDGEIAQGDQAVARIGVVDVADRLQLVKHGQTLLSYGNAKLQASGSLLHSQWLERANVDPTTELAMLMDTQRQLEANANMIRYQDQTLSKLVNEVGKIT